MDIKLDNISLKNGGLHVIIPYCMENNRVLEQCIGRCGRQGQPGSSSLYVSHDDFYYETKDFDEKFENLLNYKINSQIILKIIGNDYMIITIIILLMLNILLIFQLKI